ncbi:MAG: hypothetical protein LBI60_04775 [Bacteroidales bacterium]|jgi:hypothetical protein|nr:hypothetical protein [Bacteroidales bacterium]
MNKYRRTGFLLFCLTLFYFDGTSQDNVSTEKKSRIKPFYSLEANFGANARLENDVKGTPRNSQLLYKTLVYGGNFMGGIELNHYFKIGLGVGYSYYKQGDNSYLFPFTYYTTYYPIASLSTTTHGIPLFLFIRSNFLNKKVSPYMDLKIGNNFLINKGIVDGVVNDFGNPVASAYELPLKLNNGLYLASNIGVSIKTRSKVTVNASIGYQYVSSTINRIMLGFWTRSYEDEFIRTGWTIVDHQFMVNVGISF